MQTEFQTRLLTQSDCYQAGRTIVPRGVMVHSTGVAQPDPEVFLRRWDGRGWTPVSTPLWRRTG